MNESLLCFMVVFLADTPKSAAISTKHFAVFLSDNPMKWVYEYFSPEFPGGLEFFSTWTSLIRSDQKASQHVPRAPADSVTSTVASCSYSGKKTAFSKYAYKVL
jgi:hypothetical protein